MYVLAGAVLAGGILAFSPNARRKATAWGTVAAWYGMRLCTEAEIIGEKLMDKLHDAVGVYVDSQQPPAEVEMVAIGGNEVPLHTRVFYNADGEAQVVVSGSSAAVERDRPPCASRIYAPTIRLRESDGSTHAFPVELDGNYCLVGNVLFDPLFVAYWLQTRHDLTIEDGDTWETSFLGPGMMPMTITHKQRGVCTDDGVDVRDLPEYREEPAGAEGGTEPWLLDLSGDPSP